MRRSTRWSIGLGALVLIAVVLYPVARVENSATRMGGGDSGTASSADKSTRKVEAPAGQGGQRAPSASEETRAETRTRILPPEPDPAMQPIGYAGPERWRNTPIPCWGLRGTAPEDFEVVSDRNEHTAGNASVAISSIRQTSGWGTLYQFANAEALRGKRIEFTADLRTFGVANEASLLVRVDDASGRALALDNMWYSYGADRSQGAFGNRSLSGDNDWTSTSVVLDVPPEAHAISYGVALTGSGKVWIDNAHLEVVSDDTPTTAMQRTAAMLEPMAPFRMSTIPAAPKNLDFEPGEGCE